MASISARSQPGPGLHLWPNPGTKSWLPQRQETKKERLPEKTLGLGSGELSECTESNVNQSILKTHCPKHVSQTCRESNQEIQQTISIGETKVPHSDLTNGETPRSHGQCGLQHHTSQREWEHCVEQKAKPGQRLLPTEDNTLRFNLSSPSSPHRCKPVRKIQKLAQDSSREVQHTFVLNPSLQIIPTFEQELHRPEVIERGLNSRPFRPHTLFTFNSHRQPLFPLILLFLFASVINVSHAGPPRPARPPLLSGQPFIVFWGIKDSSCSNRPDFRSFGIEPEGRVAVFYEDTLGNYPYFVDRNTAVNGGLPQHTKLDLHILKTQGDIETALPAPRYLGLGVVRWQEWAPQWSRSGVKQGLYRNSTRKLLRRFFPDWPDPELERWSKVDFEAAAQSVMTETLREVQRSRPKALWGMCPYPSCSNGSPAQTALSNYTGECPEEERSLNDQLLWLWRRSNAIYPLLTLEKIQGGTRGATLFLSNQIREALRVASLGGSSDDLPVFPLMRSVYASTNTFLSESDLVTTIGESAALGTAGIVIWDKTESKTERECEELIRFTASVLGPYVSNVTAASRLCSASLCQNRGRCVRLDQDKPTFLHLPPNSQLLEEKSDEATDEAPDEATDQPEPSPRPDPDLDSEPEPGLDPDPRANLDPAELWKRDFQCQWFSSADRDGSEQQSPKDGAPSVGKREDSMRRGLDGLATDTDGMSTTTGAYRVQNGENGASVSPKSTLDTPVDHGAKTCPSRIMMLLRLLLALYIWI